MLEKGPTRGSDQGSENSLHAYVVCPPEHDKQLKKVNFKKRPEWKVTGGKDKWLLQISQALREEGLGWTGLTMKYNDQGRIWWIWW